MRFRSASDRLSSPPASLSAYDLSTASATFWSSRPSKRSLIVCSQSPGPGSIYSPRTFCALTTASLIRPWSFMTQLHAWKSGYNHRQRIRSEPAAHRVKPHHRTYLAETGSGARPQAQLDPPRSPATLGARPATPRSTTADQLGVFERSTVVRAAVSSYIASSGMKRRSSQKSSGEPSAGNLHAGFCLGRRVQEATLAR